MFGRSMIPDSMPVVGDFTNNQEEEFQVFGAGIHEDAKKEGTEQFALFGCAEVAEVDRPN